MKNLLTITFLLSILAFGCSKDDTLNGCEGNNTISVTLNNNSNNPYNVSYGSGNTTLSGNSSRTVSTPANVNISWVQQSGFVLFPTTGSRSISGDACSTWNVNLP